MKIGIVGLGLIGASLCKAYKANSEFFIYGYDSDKETLAFAGLYGAIDGTLNDDTVPECDCIILAIYPNATVSYLERIAPLIRPGTLVLDCCGVKQTICEQCFEIAKRYEFTFVGAHPMAGTHNSGIKYSRAELFTDASMVLVPPVYDDIKLFGRIESVLKPIGFGRLTITDAKKHDETIAFTSQLAHIVSNAYVKSPTASKHMGLSAGSYRDLTRVARLSPAMWAELFLANKEPILFELDTLIASLGKYRDAIDRDDLDKLTGLLHDGSRRKEELDGK